MLKKYPLLSRFALFVLLPLAAIICVFYLYWHQSLALYQGELKLPGIQQPVTVVFDAYGVPQVKAKSDQDAYFAQGYLHAQERMWQMELHRRFASGRLSEVFGSASVGEDIWMRTLNIYGVVEKNLEKLDPSAKAALQAYAQGVNAWLARQQPLPAEFIAFDIQPEPWRPVDSLAWQKVFALDLGHNMHDELTRQESLRIINAQKLKTFYPYDSEPGISSPELAIEKHTKNTEKTPHTPFKSWFALKNHLKQKSHIGQRHAGSNAWVIAPELSQSGAAMLANDPHLGVQQPSLWYALQMRGHRLNVSGMSIVGIPGVILGRNQNIAWGATSLMADQQDLFEIVAIDAVQDRYVYNGQVETFNIREERINIRPDMPALLNKKIKPITIRVRETAFGPLVSDVIQNQGPTLTLRWSALDKDDQSYAAFYHLQYASDWPSFRSALSRLKAPGLDFVYADVHGNIGRQVAGAMPKRGIGKGTRIQVASRAQQVWQGYVPFEQLPKQFNPTSGMIVLANSQVATPEHVIISHEWAPPVREQRIRALLRQKRNSGKKIDMDDMLSIQQDVLDLGAKALVAQLASTELQHRLNTQAPNTLRSTAAKALQQLQQWDGRFSQDSVAATIYSYWLHAFRQQVFMDDLLPNWQSKHRHQQTAQALIERVNEQQLLSVLKTASLHNEGAEWCQPQPQPCLQEATDSFISALLLLQKHAGDDTDDWRWGDRHYVEYAQQPLANIKGLDLLFKYKQHTGGSSHTVNVADVSQPSAKGFKQSLNVAFRQVFDMGDYNANRYQLPMGQSGHALSPHFSDLSSHFFAAKEKHRSNEPAPAYRQHFTSAEVKNSLRLLPAQQNAL